MKDDFSDFLLGDEPVPDKVSSETLKLLLVHLHPTKTLFKFYSSNLFGGLFTILICPQFGFGPLGGELGYFQYIMNFGPVWCGIFCASVFMAGGNLLSFILLRPAERIWISRKPFKLALPWVSMLFFLGMILKFYAPGNLHHDNVRFHFSWYLTAIVLSLVFIRRSYGPLR